jgi:hypothetical protein
MEPAATGLATHAENADQLPLSPELVLVCPELRELALREVPLPYERNGVKPQLDLLDLARARAAREGPEQRPQPPEPAFVRAAAVAVVRAAVVAVAFVAVVAAAAVGLTIAPPQTEPRLAPPPNQTEPRRPVERNWRSAPEPKPAPTAPASQGIGAPALQRGVAKDPAQAPGGIRLGYPPVAWNLRVLTDAPLRLSRKRTPPVLRGGARPLMLGASFISCGRGRWIAAGANWAVSCQPERPTRSR